MKLTSNTLSREEFEKLWKDEVENQALEGFDYTDSGSRLLYVKDDETGAICCYAQPKKTSNAFFVCDVKKQGNQFEVYRTPTGREHFNIEIEDQEELVKTLASVIRPSDKEERKTLLSVYRRNAKDLSADDTAEIGLVAPVVFSEEFEEVSSGASDIMAPAPEEESTAITMSEPVEVGTGKSVEEDDEISRLLADLRSKHAVGAAEVAAEETAEEEKGEVAAVISEDAEEAVDVEPEAFVIADDEFLADDEIVITPVAEEEDEVVASVADEWADEEIAPVEEADEKPEDFMPLTDEEPEEVEVVKPKVKNGCLVKLALTGAAVLVAASIFVSGFVLGSSRDGDTKEPVGTEDVVPGTTEPEGDVTINNNQTIIVEQVEIDDEVQDEVYNAIVKNVQVDLTKDEIKSTYVANDNQTVFAITETGLYKIDLTNGGANLGEVTNNDQLITKLQATNSVTESYKIDYLLGDKYAEACAEFEQTYKNEYSVDNAAAYVSNVELKKADSGKGFMVAPTATVLSIDAEGNATFEEYATDKVSVQRGVQLSGIDMIAASLFTDMGFTSDIYTVEDVQKKSTFFESAESKISETQNESTTEETTQTPEVETEDTAVVTDNLEMSR